MKEKNFMRKIENRGIEPAEQEVIETGEERELGEGEIGELVEYMKSYKRGLLNRIEEVKKEIRMAKDKETAQELWSELENLQEVLEGLPEFVDDIEQGNYEAITITEEL